jgi:hypothetical protein
MLSIESILIYTISANLCCQRPDHSFQDLTLLSNYSLSAKIGNNSWVITSLSNNSRAITSLSNNSRVITILSNNTLK